ncbi:hypothetical protein [Pseudoalteromonas prydzensis]|uniref:hypothetical protein n=1 Tax=Pseudoalteromonas prydzensis TaxID=182141 RepID=UPI0007E4FBB5|nr:hypothetical protein [Pseudoalteromonas prydzensis]MBE0379171.1 hypothetical protein [Pseudoalteromonas prydzensis ACAM 620]
MSLFKLNYQNNNLQDLVSEPKLEGAFSSKLDAEPLAIRHWVFDQGNSESFKDLVNNVEITRQDPETRERFNSLILPKEVGKALLSDIQCTGKDIIFAVVKKLPDAPNTLLIAGNANHEVENGGGVLLNSTGSTTVSMRCRLNDGTTPSVSSTRYAQVAENEWYFVAGYIGDLNSTSSLAIFMGPDSYGVLDISSSGRNFSTRFLGVGNAYYENHPSATDTQIAEFGIIQGQELTLEYGQTLFEHSKQRMLKRGIKLFNVK